MSLDYVWFLIYCFCSFGLSLFCVFTIFACTNIWFTKIKEYPNEKKEKKGIIFKLLINIPYSILIVLLTLTAIKYFFEAIKVFS